MMQKGFTLIEFIIGMMISAILLSAVFTIYNQIGKSIQIIEKITTDDTKIMILQDRLQKDLNGLAPLWFTKEEYEKTKDKDTVKNSQQPTTGQTQKLKASNFFYAQNKQNVFDFFTFTTTNAMQTYGEGNKHFTRVVYQLKQEQNKENTYKLMRKEMNKNFIEFDKKAILEKGTFYTIADNVKECHISYGFIDQQKPQQDQESAKDKKKETISDKPAQIKWHQDWGTSQEKTESNDYKPICPQFIKVKIMLAQKKDNQAREYELYFSIPIDTTIKITSFAQKQAKNLPPTKDAKQQNTQQEQGKDKNAAPIPKPTSKTGK